MMKVLIPTCKTYEQILPLIEELERNTSNIDIIYSCTPGSAAQNRNICLSKCEIGELIISIDDDMTGFYNSWATSLVEPFTRSGLNKELNPIIVSARLMRPDGRVGTISGDVKDISEPYVKSPRLPTACIAHINYGIKFDEMFVGAGFEDDDFCRNFKKLYPEGNFIINNNVKLIHLNEMKNQGGEFWKKNKAYYLAKWVDEKDRWHE